MFIAALLEKSPETRVALTPHAAKQLIKRGFDVAIEENAGALSGYSNEDYAHIGVRIVTHKKELLEHTHILVCVHEPKVKELTGLAPGALLIAPIDNDPDQPLIAWCMKNRITVFSMNLIPRISRAQSMDSLSSQANLAGYKAVLEAAHVFHRALPMMMTAAGMIQPAKVLVLGAGIAGLQAIATAKRLGAVVYAFDVRRAAKEQVESVGAEFIEVPFETEADSSSGYATQTSDAYKQLQTELIDTHAKNADIIITTALIPGQPAPILLPKETVARMKPGSVVVDLATSRGGNCAVSVMDKTIQHDGVTIIGYSHLARMLPGTASDLYANNMAQVIALFEGPTQHITLNPDDEIIQQAILCHDGQYLPFKKCEEPNHA